MKRFFFLIKHVLKKLLIARLFTSYVVNDKTIQEDINQTIKVRGCTVQPDTLKKRFEHLMIYYPDFAFIFFWRIKRKNYLWKRGFTKAVPCKIFRSTKIAGGMVCYHPFATVINAKSIGENFQFRNGLTIGNKSNNNTMIPVIGNNVTVGANVVIIGNITIGNDVVIGAGSVVVKDVPSNCVIAGNPAKIIKLK
ncbi:serine acetyltransferase [Lacinutrix sp. C3R15]|uniref:serine acetyltransferase n=1 Tax=Flavobacteriaceae TaxID=49546 RepID=UPI001C09CA75|nr:MULTISPECIES: serine acetyltransferase [Flavobacteriaceae]MBU2939573.1 serine acetyltransferase [Lacinutrix sp. C3R15]MDO6622887.1 serine acetyltransferase [Oceanihabitans sp. 1_MG-2023]